MPIATCRYKRIAIYRDGNHYVIKYEHWDEFIAYAEPADDAMAAERICDAMNTGFALGFPSARLMHRRRCGRALGME